MRVGFDSTMLSLLLNPDSRAPNDPDTGLPTAYVQQRIQGLLNKLQRSRSKIVIPTPVVAEVLTLIGPTNGDYLSIVNRSKVFEVRPFDELAALELAFLNRDIFAASDKKSGAEPYQKVKIDRQILAICKVARCDAFYTDDKGLIGRAKLCDMPIVRISELPIPDEARQHELGLEEHEPLAPVQGDDVSEADV